MKFFQFNPQNRSDSPKIQDIIPTFKSLKIKAPILYKSFLSLQDMLGPTIISITVKEMRVFYNILFTYLISHQFDGKPRTVAMIHLENNHYK